ncbi:hypothetical protein METUNv1_00272 [Methyloversatilis universalis FAM5]|uniref:Uncharacterized protein n=1 Tax=Methyloversatilis universalis (strain ATCC BAA-1314 / DSM 25237 / JCM 13912 / CCUG 52030 / FAM5) TaxID=1000565 RepID=F5R7W8_METUF|nr:hypothetical protein METUNv1_00272 [Methyloversatilis universalis FAM5]
MVARTAAHQRQSGLRSGPDLLRPDRAVVHLVADLDGTAAAGLVGVGHALWRQFRQLPERQQAGRQLPDAGRPGGEEIPQRQHGVGSGPVGDRHRTGLRNLQRRPVATGAVQPGRPPDPAHAAFQLVLKRIRLSLIMIAG